MRRQFNFSIPHIFAAHILCVTVPDVSSICEDLEARICVRVYVECVIFD